MLSNCPGMAHRLIQALAPNSSIASHCALHMCPHTFSSQVESMTMETECGGTVDVPVVCLLHVQRDLPDCEMPHLSHIPREDGRHTCLRSSLSVRPDGTVAVEVRGIFVLWQLQHMGNILLLRFLESLHGASKMCDRAVEQRWMIKWALHPQIPCTGV